MRLGRSKGVQRTKEQRPRRSPCYDVAVIELVARVALTCLLTLPLAPRARAQALEGAPAEAVAPAAQTPYPPPPYVGAAPYPPPAYAAPVDPLTRAELKVRLRELAVERKELLRAGRPDHYLRRKVGGFVGLGVGAVAMVLATTAYFAIVGPPGPHSSSDDEDVSTRAGAAIVSTLLFGGAVMGVGLWALATAGHPNPHQPRIDVLEQEYERVHRQIRSAPRALAPRLSPRLALGRAGGLGLAIQQRF